MPGYAGIVVWNEYMLSCGSLCRADGSARPDSCPDRDVLLVSNLDYSAYLASNQRLLAWMGAGNKIRGAGVIRRITVRWGFILPTRKR